MRTIMAFGDSLTWGTSIARGRRHEFHVRWPNVLQVGLGQGYHVIAEGLGGRTTIFDDPGSPVDKNASRALPMLLGSHNPLDLVIIMLGANDLKPHLCGKAEGAARGIGVLVDITKNFPYNWAAPPPKVLIVSPPHFTNKADGDGPEGGRDVAESLKLARLYREVAHQHMVNFWDAATVASADPLDGVHLDVENTKAIGTGLLPVVTSLLA